MYGLLYLICCFLAETGWSVIFCLSLSMAQSQSGSQTGCRLWSGDIAAHLGGLRSGLLFFGQAFDRTTPAVGQSIGDRNGPGLDGGLIYLMPGKKAQLDGMEPV